MTESFDDFNSKKNEENPDKDNIELTLNEDDNGEITSDDVEIIENFDEEIFDEDSDVESIVVQEFQAKNTSIDADFEVIDNFDEDIFEENVDTQEDSEDANDTSGESDFTPEPDEIVQDILDNEQVIEEISISILENNDMALIHPTHDESIDIREEDSLPDIDLAQEPIEPLQQDSVSEETEPADELEAEEEEELSMYSINGLDGLLGEMPSAEEILALEAELLKEEAEDSDVEEIIEEPEIVFDEDPAQEEVLEEQEPTIGEDPVQEEVVEEQEPIIEEDPVQEEVVEEQEPIIEEEPAQEEVLEERELIIEEDHVQEEVVKEQEPIIEEELAQEEVVEEQEPIIEEEPAQEEVIEEQEPIIEEEPAQEEVVEEQEPTIEEELTQKEIIEEESITLENEASTCYSMSDVNIDTDRFFADEPVAKTSVDSDLYGIVADEQIEEPMNFFKEEEPVAGTDTAETEQEEIDDNEPLVVAEKVLAENKTLYLIRHQGVMSLVGIIDEDVFVLKKFDEFNEKMKLVVKLNETRENENIYIVKSGKWRALISVSADNMENILTLS